MSPRNIDTTSWREFMFGDLVSEIKKAKAYTKDELIEVPFSVNRNSEAIRYITRTAANNGCEMIVSRLDHLEPGVEIGNAITIGDTTATCFYQEEDFLAGDHMVVVRADWLNPLTGMFVVALLNAESYRYSYGRAFIMKSIRETSLKLPVLQNESGIPIIDPEQQFHAEGYIPDWQFIENFILDLSHKPITTSNFSHEASLNTENWHFFLLKDICSIDMGNKMDFSAMTNDNASVNFVGRSAEHNGVMGKVDKVPNVAPYPAGALSVALGGSLGSTYLQDEPFYTSQNVCVLQFNNEEVSLLARLFVANMVQFESRFKYFPFGRELNKYIRTIYGFDLPIKRDESGAALIDAEKRYHSQGYVPDWQLMENFMRELPFGDRIPQEFSDITGSSE